MHYKNGREAKNGDTVIIVPVKGSIWPKPVIGILYNATPGNNSCNGSLALLTPSDPCADLAQCLHIDDAAAVISGAVPDTAGGAQ